MNYQLIYTRQAQKDAKKLKGTNLAKKAKELLQLIAEDPLASPPPYEALVGDLRGAYSRRINIQHRLVYSIDEEHTVIKVLRLWTHYE
ncbi:Txe/YoeB family addiction module toxin [Persicirhabdus sediminis]|uniref:Putative mRNA interferase YoeB n=1 Tax=Persicirhabdus sediminis TaxID=454144 RepID=A0A8J7SKQ7_9BACT|nr:Txe/YoeB family addiction module toxin [Persicirhabdus sediminis]MBK1790930.1 Txe/YoeB family addiction module toxin [Persicirhabdus sediminis]